MRIADLAPDILARRLRRGLPIGVGDYVVRISSPVDRVASGIGLLYSDFPVSDEPFADFHVRVVPRRSPGRGFRAEAHFVFDGFEPFLPLPLDQAFAFLEWGLNWCVSAHVLDRLIVHAATLERGGRALLLPGAPGSGKSTLCAALTLRGWRLLSDEFALALPGEARLAALPRPINLKNESIRLVRARAPHAVMTASVRDTRKGEVAQLRPAPEAVRRMREPAQAAWIVFPRYVPGAGADLTARSDGDALMALLQNAFNYGALGEAGFRTAVELVRAAGSFELAFGDLDGACAAIEELGRQDGSQV